MRCRDVIESERLRLRRPARRDLPALVAAFNVWSIAQWLAIPPYPFTDADAEAFLSWAHQPDADGFNGKFIVADRGSDQFLGVVTLSQQGDQAELGYWLNPLLGGRAI